MADVALPAGARSAEPLPARRARVLRRIEDTRADVGVEWNGFRAAVADGEARSRATMSAVRTGAKWALAFGALWLLRRRQGRLTWSRAALLAALARAAVRRLFRISHRGERHVEH